MRPLSSAELLIAWERGLTQSTVQRALTLLAIACVGTPIERLMQLTIGQRDARLLALREWAFGPQIEGIDICPSCNERLEIAFNVADIRVPPSSSGSKSDAVEIELYALDMAPYTLSFRLPNSLDLATITQHSDVASSHQALFECCLLSAQCDGTVVSVVELPDEIITAAIARMAEADPQADVQLALTCPSCGHQWQATFDILSFFWQEINDWAQCILREVHRLATAYGWREADILALSPQRRRLYLELVG